ncbi:MAG: DUF3999 domain-containing protein [Lysobacter sp.]|nr:DUF3999 domain-containing protein [Lysobacter sp.]
MSTLRRIASHTVRSTFALALSTTLAVGAAYAAGAVGASDDYAYRWPLKTEGNNVAWQFELTPEVYAALRDPQLRDFEVFNADGRSVPVAPLRDLNQTMAQMQWMQWSGVPTFELPHDATQAAGDVSVRLERDSAGQVRVIEANVQGATQTNDGSTTQPPAPSAIDYVIDASGLRRESQTVTFDRLELEWAIGDRDLRTRFAVDASDDLEHWQTLVDSAAVMSLRQQGATLTRRTIDFPSTSLPYLRLRQLDGDALPSLQVKLRRNDPANPTYSDFVTRVAEAQFADSEEDSRGRWYRYRLPASLPAIQLSVALATENTTADVEVEALVGEEWRLVGNQSVFRLRQGELKIENEDLPLGNATVAREWRLRTVAPLETPPELRVTYLPDRFVFLAQGKGPYTLAAGSRGAKRTALPVEQALAPMRKHLGAEWQPPVATLGARAVAGGDAAYDEPKTPPNWRGWLLWVLLIGGALIVAGFAMSLIRQKPAVGGE